MGNPRQKWTQEEEDALRAGVAKHGTGKWINIQQDPEFRPHLYSRSNIDLKDKWRNMSVGANGQGPREKARTPKPKGADSPATPMPISQVPGSSSVAIVPADPVPTDVIMEDSSKCLLDGKTASKYNAMIYEALSTMKDPNGSDTSATDSFIEAKQKWTQEEEALRAGVAKHGIGKRKNIQKDPEFNPHLYSRSNIDLMDKWRNMSVGANGQGPREKARTPKPKGADSPATPMPISQVPGSSSVAIVPADPVPTDVIMEDSSKCLLDGKTASKYNAMINEALSTLKDPNGSYTSATVSFIEAKQKWTQEEEDALRAGVAKHGTGKWKIIQKDPEFNPHLYSRSNIDLKDKWRNMSVGANGQGPREKARTPKPKGADSPATPMPISQFPGSSSVAIVPADPVPTDVIMEDSSKCLVDGKTASKQSDTAAVNSDCSPDYVPTRSSKWKKAKSGRKRARRGRPTKADSSDQEIVELVGPSAFVIIDDDASVETVVSVWKSAISGVGQEFSDVYEFREALQRYAMANGFEYELKKDYTSRAYGVCTGKGCSWKFNAVWDPTTESFKIKMMNNVHTCDLESRVNSLVITLNEKLQESPHLKPKEIANQLLKDPGAKSGRKRARRGRPTKADSSDQEIVELVGPSAFVIIDDDASVETVVSVWKSAISGVGQEFSDVYEFREALQRYAMANGFEYELKKNYTNRANGVCTGEGCSWKFNAVRDRTTQSFKIKTMNNVHTCDLESRVNSLVITLNEKLQESPHLNPKEIANQLLKDPEAKSGRKRACRPRPTKVDSSDLEIYKFVGPSALAIIDDDASVETVVSVWKSAISGVGQEFSNIYEFREALQRYAMANGFEYKLKKNYTNCANGVCTGEGCSWKFNAVWDPTTQSFKIKTMNNVHTCDLESRVNSLVITLNEKLQESPHLKPKEIANQLLKDPGVDLNHGTMVVRDERLGSDKESYNMLPWFCDKIIETNPGSISKLIVGENKRFKALFVSFYASLYGFQNSCRPLLFLEATSLRSMYGEVLLTANTIDGNDDFFPVAFAIVDVEDANNWRWFLEQLKAAILYSQPMTFVFDMEKNLKRSVFEVFQDAHVGYSIYHLLESFNRNVKVRCLGGGKYFLAAAHAVRLVGFRKSIEQIKLISSLAYDWVMQIEPQHWANSSFKGERYNHITDDVGGSLAKLMEDYQESSILQKIDALIHSMIDAINDAKLDACMWSTYLTPSKEKQLQEESLRSCGLKVLISSDTLFEVREESTHVVNIGDWSCTCLGWKETGLPCRHSLAVFALIGRNPYEYCANYFTVDAYRLTYLESINQVPIEMEKGEKFEVRKPGFEKGQTLVTVGENEEGGEDIEVEEENGEKIEMKNAGDGNEGKTNGDNDYAEKEDCEKTKAEDEHIDFEIDEAGGEKEESMKVGGGNEESAKVENEKMEAEKHEGVKGKISETDNDPNVPVLPPIHNKWVTTRNLATSTRRNKLVN